MLLYPGIPRVKVYEESKRIQGLVWLDKIPPHHQVFYAGIQTSNNLATNQSAPSWTLISLIKFYLDLTIGYKFAMHNSAKIQFFLNVYLNPLTVHDWIFFLPPELFCPSPSITTWSL